MAPISPAQEDFPLAVEGFGLPATKHGPSAGARRHRTPPQASPDHYLHSERSPVTSPVLTDNVPAMASHGAGTGLDVGASAC